MSKYPVWRYHRDKMPEGCIVRSEEQDIALGEGWVDTPAKFQVQAKAEAKGPQADAPAPEAAPSVVQPRRRSRRGGAKA